MLKTRQPDMMSMATGYDIVMSLNQARFSAFLAMVVPDTKPAMPSLRLMGAGIIMFSIRAA